jgi:hypothetical protein
VKINYFSRALLNDEIYFTVMANHDRTEATMIRVKKDARVVNLRRFFFIELVSIVLAKVNPLPLSNSRLLILLILVYNFCILLENCEALSTAYAFSMPSIQSLRACSRLDIHHVEVE